MSERLLSDDIFKTLFAKVEKDFSMAWGDRLEEPVDALSGFQPISDAAFPPEGSGWGLSPSLLQHCRHRTQQPLVSPSHLPLPLPDPPIPWQGMLARTHSRCPSQMTARYFVAHDRCLHPGAKKASLEQMRTPLSRTR
ncbi:unnamed protein product [Polarella glacialis]|uniref:Uncharacterized protein n=1 Tax=Polarella glacialis TaxID=89957 RepID=A0A813LHY0_POLGL|nr:unnamed protein product [Polarella glacialis]